MSEGCDLYGLEGSDLSTVLNVEEQLQPRG